MKIQVIVVESICCLFVLLFGYTATSKIIDFQSFWVDIGRNFSIVDKYQIMKPVAIFVILIELVTAIFLVIPRLRKVGLFSALALMAFFTFYVARILSFSQNVPCTCGGVLREMTWTQHFWFNVAFTTLAIIAIFLRSRFVGKHIIKRRVVQA